MAEENKSPEVEIDTDGVNEETVVLKHLKYQMKHLKKNKM